MSNPYTVAKDVEHHAEAYGATMVRCEWVPGTRKASAYYRLTANVSGESWALAVSPRGGWAQVSKFRDGCPVAYEIVDSTPLRETRPADRTPKGYLLHFVRTYASGYDYEHEGLPNR